MKKILLTYGFLVLFILQSMAQISYDSLPFFLVKAKIATYASGDESKTITCEKGCKEINYVKGDFKYRDRYFGEYNFSGEEIVWWHNKVIWSMNYFGVTDTTESLPDKFPDFLKEALRQVDTSSPFRGSKYYSRGDFEYINEFDGDLKDFSGQERINHKGKLIYKLYYHGGEIIY
jgi:hypothetical protein